jgi:hypothetical protein
MMRNAREKGKIPITERPRILAKYAAGEKVAHIARDYGCTPAAIRYILNRSNKQPEALDAATKGEGTPHPAARAPRSPLRGGDARPAPGRYAFKTSGQNTVLDIDLYTRVTGDAVTFLAALDRTTSEGSVESLEGLQDAIEKLMRSAARTSLEVGRLLETGASTRAAGGQSVFTGV